MSGAGLNVRHQSGCPCFGQSSTESKKRHSKEKRAANDADDAGFRVLQESHRVSFQSAGVP